jgi:hypothetical protein
MRSPFASLTFAVNSGLISSDFYESFAQRHYLWLNASETVQGDLTKYA